MSLSDKIEDILHESCFNITNDYNHTALLLNSCNKARQYYREKPDNIRLENTGNIPLGFLMSMEITTPYNKEKLLNAYGNDLLIKIV